MLNPFKYSPKGDKQNSDYFNEYRLKIYERRKACGLDGLIGDIQAIVIQIQTGYAFQYLQELYYMMPYRYHKSYISDTHRIYILKNSTKSPLIFVLEPLDPKFVDDITRMNRMYPNSRAMFNSRYIGEILKTSNLTETKQILESHDFNFMNADSVANNFFINPNLSFTRYSGYSFNSIGYVAKDLTDCAEFEFGQPFQLTKAQQAKLVAIDEFTINNGTKKLMKGIDHMATRILSDEREDAILEFLCLSNYYFWGAYNINDMNSSTNVNRVLHGNDIKSPAKVFTANNTPFMVNSFAKRPMPTENFVRNYGRRMHHIAIEISDGEQKPNLKNLDYVIDTLKNKADIGFLAKVFGECKDEPDLKQIFSKHSELSLLITEYVERCHNFDGFFTKHNVAALTKAAGLDENVQSHHQQKGVIGD